MAAAHPPADSSHSQAAHSYSYDPKRPLNLDQVKCGWHSAIKEYDYWVPTADIEGKLPPDLQGTLMRNGPGLSEVYGKRLVHRELYNMSSLV